MPFVVESWDQNDYFMKIGHFQHPSTLHHSTQTRINTGPAKSVYKYQFQKVVGSSPETNTPIILLGIIQYDCLLLLLLLFYFENWKEKKLPKSFKFDEGERCRAEIMWTYLICELTLFLLLLLAIHHWCTILISLSRVRSRIRK